MGVSASLVLHTGDETIVALGDIVDGQRILVVAEADLLAKVTVTKLTLVEYIET